MKKNILPALVALGIIAITFSTKDLIISNKICSILSEGRSASFVDFVLLDISQYKKTSLSSLDIQTIEKQQLSKINRVKIEADKQKALDSIETFNNLKSSNDTYLYQFKGRSSELQKNYYVVNGSDGKVKNIYSGAIGFASKTCTQGDK